MPIYRAAELDEARFLLHGLPLFDLLPPEVRRLVSDAFEPRTYDYGEVIYTEGDESDAFYVVVEGRARELKEGDDGDEVSLSVFERGDSFGEREVLEGTRRVTTVRAAGSLTAFRLDRGLFQALAKRNSDLARWAVMQAHAAGTRELLRLETPFAALRPEQVERLIADLEPLAVRDGDVMAREGTSPDAVYLIVDGRFEVHRSDNGRSRVLAYLRRGDVFGEAGVLDGTPRPASVVALGTGRVLRLSAARFERLLGESPELRARFERDARERYGDDRRAPVPLDLAHELLPAMSGTYRTVSPDQIDEGDKGLAADPDAAGISDDRFHGPRAPIKSFPFVRQVDEADCGAACMAMVTRHFGRAVSLARIRELVATGIDGTSLAGITRGAEELGLASRGIKSSPDKLHTLPLPAVLHWGGNHWVVLYAVDGDKVRIADPGSRRKTIARAELGEEWTGYAALFARTPALDDAPEGRPDAGWILRFFRPHRRTLVAALGLALLAAVLEAALPVFTQVVVDEVLSGARGVGLLNVLALALVGVLAAMVGATVLRGYLLSRVAVRIDSETLDFLTQELLGLPMSYFNRRRTGDIERRLSGLEQVRQFAVQSGVQALVSVTTLVVVLAVMTYYSVLLTLVFLATVPLYALMMRWSAKRLRPVFETLEESLGRYRSHQIDAIRGIETVKALGAEGSLRQKMLREFEHVAGRRFRAEFTLLSYDGVIQLTTFLTLGLFLYVGSRQVLAGSLTIGELVSFNALVALANAPLLALLQMWDQLQTSAVLLNRLSDILEQEPEQGADRAGLQRVPTLEGRISLRGVSYRFGGPATPNVVDDLTIDIAPGTSVAIVGRSGSGKTTLIKCLAGLLEPTEGTILYDGHDLRGLHYGDLRTQIGFVLQENYLFDETIARNIALGESEPDMDRVRWAAGVANAREFVERLPLAYETKVGESGLLLSGGQKQRIAIARAVYQRPPVLIFDEATSALDTESERAVKESMDELLRGRTSFVIAHRLSTIRDADLILVLEQGRLVERGTHAELMERRGLYYHLASRQLEL